MAREFLLKHIPNEARMLELGEKIAKAFSEKGVIFLYGNLGAGKTTLVRGFLRGLGYQGIVKSPTYTIVESYAIQGRDIYHFDFYRVKDVQELEYIGLVDYFHEKSINLIEWPENAENVLPPADVSCYIEPHILGRDIKLVAHTDVGCQLLGKLSK